MKKNMHKKYTNRLQRLGALPKSHHALLVRTVSSLTPSIELAGFDKFFDQLDAELVNSGLIHVKIEKYFGDEWFCPDKTTAIAVPFWLADKKLKSIERRLVGFVEGESEDEFMRLLRHEAGHCIEHAYRLSKRQDWQKIFGDPKIHYDPDSVKTVPGHPDFVENISGGYAQTHPEEDFAETFAVWLGYKTQCWVDYRYRPVALRKLMFIEQLILEIAPKKPRKLSSVKICNARRMRRSLESYYRNRLSDLGQNQQSKRPPKNQPKYQPKYHAEQISN